MTSDLLKKLNRSRRYGKVANIALGGRSSTSSCGGTYGYL